MEETGDRIRSAARRAKAGLASLRRDERPDRIDAAIAVLRDVPPADLQARGWHFHVRDFYSPQNELEFLALNRDLWHDRPLPRGIDWNLDGQLEAVRRIAPYTAELAAVPRDMPPGPPAYHWGNDFWSGSDALVHYGLIRDVKPRRVIEIGCGWSSLLLAEAVVANERDGAPRAIVDQVEPYPRTELLRALPADWNLHEAILQRAPLELFETLEDGDVCFYDGSHVARTASDVVWFFSEVLPRLRPGVIVHLHDIFWPADYPDEWIFERDQTWNEQYVLQAFLMYNSDFAPLICTSVVASEFPAELAEAFAGVPEPAGPGASVWLRRTGGGDGR